MTAVPVLVLLFDVAIKLAGLPVVAEASERLGLRSPLHRHRAAPPRLPRALPGAADGAARRCCSPATSAARCWCTCASATRCSATRCSRCTWARCCGRDCSSATSAFAACWLHAESRSPVDPDPLGIAVRRSGLLVKLLINDAWSPGESTGKFLMTYAQNPNAAPPMPQQLATLGVIDPDQLAQDTTQHSSSPKLHRFRALRPLRCFALSPLPEAAAPADSTRTRLPSNATTSACTCPAPTACNSAA